MVRAESGLRTVPDGMTIDCDGNLWVALGESGCVVCYDAATGVCAAPGQAALRPRDRLQGGGRMVLECGQAHRGWVGCRTVVHKLGVGEGCLAVL